MTKTKMPDTRYQIDNLQWRSVVSRPPETAEGLYLVSLLLYEMREDAIASAGAFVVATWRNGHFEVPTLNTDYIILSWAEIPMDEKLTEFHNLASFPEGKL